MTETGPAFTCGEHVDDDATGDTGWCCTLPLQHDGDHHWHRFVVTARA